MATDGRTTYTPELKEQALGIYVELGPAEASRRCGIPSATIRSWARRAGKSSPRAEHAVAGAQAARLSWAQRRAEVALRSGEAAAELIEKMRQAPKPREAADWARAFAIDVPPFAVVLTHGPMRSSSMNCCWSGRTPRDRAARCADQRRINLGLLLRRLRRLAWCRGGLLRVEWRQCPLARHDLLQAAYQAAGAGRVQPHVGLAV